MNILIACNVALMLFAVILCVLMYFRRPSNVEPSVPPMPPVDLPKKAVSNLDTCYDGLDLSGAPRATYRLVLRNGQTIHLRTPTKAVADSFDRIGSILQRISTGRQSNTDENELYMLASRILSHNTAGLQVNAQKVMDDLTLAELTELLTDYMSWLTGVIESKN